MKVMKAIHKATGEVIAIYTQNWTARGEELQGIAKKGELLCAACKNPVEVILNPFPGIPFIFVCHSELDHLDIDDINSPEAEFFDKNERDYYDPEKFEHEEY